MHHSGVFMPGQILISQMHLSGLYAAVSSVNHQLAIPIHAALSSKPVVGILDTPLGGQVGPKYALNISSADAQAVLDCLVNLETTHGYNAKFGGFQINALVMLWREFSRLLESSDTPKLPNAG
jgi:hypothetical protein